MRYAVLKPFVHAEAVLEEGDTVEIQGGDESMLSLLVNGGYAEEVGGGSPSPAPAPAPNPNEDEDDEAPAV